MSDAPYKKNNKALSKKGKKAHGVRTGEWNSSIFGCCTFLVPNCCMATFLPFISIAQIAHRINVARYSYVLLAFLALYVLEIVFAVIAAAAIMSSLNSAMEDMNSGRWDDDKPVLQVSTTGVASAAFAQIAGGVVAMLYFVAIWQLRTKVRDRFQIPGSCCGDYCCVWWCSCCTIAQMATHVKSYKPGSCDFGPPDVLPPYDIGTPDS